MRNLFSILCVCLLLTSSCAGTYRQASHVSSQTYVGMSINEFKKIAGRKASLEAMENGFTVYKMRDYDAWTGGLIDVKFFYFNSDGKLYKFDGGEFRQARYQIEHINR